MSAQNRELSSHTLGLIKRVTIEIGKDDEITDSENFQDIRMELNSTGHNLVINSVAFGILFCNELTFCFFFTPNRLLF